MDKVDTIKKRRRGFLLEMTDDRKQRVLSQLRHFRGIVSNACKEAGVGRSTFYKWVNEDDEFAQRVCEIQEEQIDFVEDKLLTLIEQGNSTAIIFYLKTRGRKRGWDEHYQFEPDFRPIRIEIVRGRNNINENDNLLNG